jgi:hypothetical protein
MKRLRYLLVLVFVISACKTNKTIVDVTNVKKMNARKVVKKHEETQFTANTLESKIKVRYTNKKGGKQKRQDFTVRLRMIKDSLIWMRGTKAITVFKLKITPDSFSYYSPLSKEYFEGDFSLLERLLGLPMNFQKIQDLLLGKSVFDMKSKRFSSKIVDNSYQLTPKSQEDIFQVFFKVNPRHFKLDQMFLEHQKKDQTLRVDYNEYTQVNGDFIPKKMLINATDQDTFTLINLEYRSLKLNEPIRISYRIPSGYKRIEI